MGKIYLRKLLRHALSEMKSVEAESSSNKSFLGCEPLGRLMVRLAVPTIFAQVINLLYNIVDRVFIGHIAGAGTDALTGVGVAFPLIMLVSAFSAFAGAGGAPLASIALGRNDSARANRILQNTVVLLLVFAVVLLLVIYPLRDPLLLMFGASSATLPYASSYLTIYLTGTFFVMAYLGLNPFVLAQGNAKRTLIAMASGAILNILLDPLFIFVLNMGVQGAALASVISQGVSAVITVSYFRSKKSALRLEAKLKRPEGALIKQILALGGAPFFMQATESLIIIVLNGTLQAYGGDLHVAALTILQSMMQLLFVPVQGLTQGVQPIISYSFGAQKFDRVRSACKRVIGIAFAFELSCVLLVILFPGTVASAFTNDTTLIALVESTAPIYFAGMTLFGLQVAIQSIFMGLGQSKLALIVAFSRKLVLLIPLALILPQFLGTTGVYLAEPISDVISVTLCTVLFLVNFKKLLNVKTLERIM